MNGEDGPSALATPSDGHYQQQLDDLELEQDLGLIDRRRLVFFIKLSIANSVGALSAASGILTLVRHWDSLGSTPAVILVFSALLIVGGICLYVYTLYEFFSFRADYGRIKSILEHQKRHVAR